MIDFVRRFVCPNHTLSEYGGKLKLIERLEQAERAQAQAADSKQSLSNVVDESETDFAGAGANGSPVMPPHTNGVDDWPHDEPYEGPGEASASRGLADFSIGDIEFSSPSTPDDESDTASPGGHDTHGPAIEQSDLSLEHDMDTDPQDHPGITTSDRMIRSLPGNVQGSPVLEISGIRLLSSLLAHLAFFRPPNIARFPRAT